MHQHSDISNFIFIKTTTTMPLANQHEENKVLETLKLLRQNPKMKVLTAYRKTRASYDRIKRRIKGIPRLSSRGGYNKKLDVLSSIILKEYLLIYHYLGRSAGIEHCWAIANSILRCDRKDATASRK
jgi:predicted Zn-dependent protease